jgi:2-dehydro-3-deoxyphosphogluconate aldolase/(4S)-4-hydroxy-2-oxoglutarate aldolase
MNRQEIRKKIEAVGIMPAVRVSAGDLALFGAEALYEAGIRIVEITMTVPGATQVIGQLSAKYSDFIVGAGTVLDEETAKACLDAGARYLTSPGYVPDVVNFALKHGMVVIPGAMTPSEVIAGWKAGADFVKVFPCAHLGGPKYIRALKVPLPQIPLIASGGVDQVTASKFIAAGASALGIGAEILPLEALQSRNRPWIFELARRFIGIIEETRSQMEMRDYQPVGR